MKGGKPTSGNGSEECKIGELSLDSPIAFRRQTMSDAETKPAGKPEIKPVAKAETKSAGKAENKQASNAETKAGGKAENRQAGKGSKRRPTNAKQFAANYEAIHWGKGQSQRPKR